ncbi:MAG: hypothetical protein ABFC57_10770 [Veillonellales bacterium]
MEEIRIKNFDGAISLSEMGNTLPDEDQFIFTCRRKGRYYFKNYYGCRFSFLNTENHPYLQGLKRGQEVLLEISKI